MQYLYNRSGDPVLQLIYNQRGQAIELSQLASNPALPPMLQEPFRRIAENLEHGANAAESSWTTNALSGMGPVAQSLFALQKFYGVGTDDDLKHLAVRTGGFWSAEEMSAYDIQKGYGTIFKFFNQYFPKYSFTFDEPDPEGKRRRGDPMGKLEHSFSMFGYDAKLVVTYSPVQETMGWIKSVEIEYSPTPRFWTVSFNIQRDAVLYRRYQIGERTTAWHHLDSIVSGAVRLTEGVRLFAEVIIPEIYKTFEITPPIINEDDYQFEHGKSFFDLMPMVEGLLQETGIVTEERKRTFYGSFFSNLRWSKEGNNIKMPLLMGKVSIGPGHSCWTSYEKWDEDGFNKRHYPMFVIKDCELFGVTGLDRECIPSRFKPSMNLYLRPVVMTFIEKFLERERQVEEHKSRQTKESE